MSIEPVNTDQVLVNGEPHPIRGPLAVADLIKGLGLSGRRLAVEVNGEIVPRSDHVSRRLQPGDRVEVVAAIGGG